MAPCNCRKKTTPITSAGREASTTTSSTTVAERKWYSPGPQSSGGTFALKVDGKIRTYGSQLEYDAAKRRAGM